MRPRAKPHVALVPIAQDALLVKGPGLFLRYGGEAVPVVLALVPLMDGTRDVAALAAATGQREEDVRDVVAALLADKVIEDAAADEPPRHEDPRLAPQVQAWSHLMSRPHQAQNRVAAARVVVLGEGSVAEAVESTLRAAGVGKVQRGGPLDGASHVVAAADRPSPRFFREANDAHQKARGPWTGLFLDGLEASVGPTVIPGQTACWRCYDLRVKGAHPNLDRLLAFESGLRQAPADVALPSFAPIAGAWAAQMALLHVAQVGLPPLAGWVTRVAFLDGRAERHRVLRMPRCPACTPGDVPDVDRYALEPVEP